MLRESSARWNQVTHDHVLFESTQTIDLAERRSFGEHASRVLKRRRRNKAVGFERGFGDTEQNGNCLGRFTAFLDDLLVLFLEVELVDLIAPEQRSVARIGN